MTLEKIIILGEAYGQQDKEKPFLYALNVNEDGLPKGNVIIGKFLNYEATTKRCMGSYVIYKLKEVKKK